MSEAAPTGGPFAHCRIADFGKRPLAFQYSLARARIRARATVRARVGINDVFRVSLGDRLEGTLR